MTAPKHALVTGASRGIGRAIAERLADEGYDLTISARKPDPLEAAAEQLRARGGGRVMAVPADMLDPEQVVALADAFRGQHRTLDVLVIAAGIGTAGPVHGYPVTRFDSQFAVNLRGPFVLIQHLLPELRAVGAIPDRVARIIAIASITGVVGHPDLSVYGATKAALISLCESITAAESANGVSATTLAPGYVATDMTAWLHGQIPVGEMIQAGDVAELAVALCRLSRHAVVPNIVMTRPGGQLWRP